MWKNRVQIGRKEERKGERREGGKKGKRGLWLSVEC